MLFCRLVLRPILPVALGSIPICSGPVDTAQRAQLDILYADLAGSEIPFTVRLLSVSGVVDFCWIQRCAEKLKELRTPKNGKCTELLQYT